MKLKSAHTSHQCNLCDKKFNNYTVLVVHKRAHFNEKPVTCSSCGEGFSCLSSLKTHFLKEHKEEQDQLLQHRHRHHHHHPQHHVIKTEEQQQQQPHQGGVGNGFDFKEDFDWSIVQPTLYSAENLFPCFICDQVFADDVTLQKHRKTKHIDRSIKKKWACVECEYSSDRKNDYQRHIGTHLNVKTHQCGFCGRYFTLKGNLVAHIKTVHTKEHSHKCKTCSKTFTQRGSLLKHQRSVHEKVKSYVCIHCGKTYPYNHILKSHMRTHTNEKPFACSYCGKTFNNSSGLSQHKIRMHTRAFAHVCQLCGKGFMRPAELRRHLQKVHLEN